MYHITMFQPTTDCIYIGRPTKLTRLAACSPSLPTQLALLCCMHFASYLPSSLPTMKGIVGFYWLLQGFLEHYPAAIQGHSDNDKYT